MPLTIGTQRALLRKQTYIQKVLGSNPIAYWPLDEKSGTVARCYVNPAQNGTYARDVSVMTTGAGIGDGNTSPTFDGANDFVDIYSATLAAAFSVAAGSVALWARVSAAGIWTDGSNDVLSHIGVNGTTNFVRLMKAAAADNIQASYVAGGVTDTSAAVYNNVAWFQAAFSWDTAADQAIFYLGGVQQGAALETLGVWAGALGATVCAIGAQTTTPALPWSGWLAHCIVWDRALAPAEIAALAVV